MTVDVQNDEYKGFALFSDIDDQALRNRNRAVVLANIAADNVKDGRISPKGTSLVLGYFNAIPEAERDDVFQRFHKNMTDRGFALVSK